MSVRLLVYIFTFVVIFLTGILVLLNNKRSITNQTFFLFLVTDNMWLLSLIFADNTSSLEIATYASKTAFISGVLLLLALLYFSFAFPGKYFKAKRITLIYFLIPAIVLIGFTGSPLLIESVSIKDFGADVVAGPVYGAFFVYILVYLCATMINFFKILRHSKGAEKNQVYFIITGVLSSGLLIVLTNIILVILGVSSLGYLGPPSSLIFISLTTYAIVRHRLFNIRAVVARSVAYVLTIALVGTVYGFTAFRLITVFLQNTSAVFQQSVYTILAIVLAFTFQPIKRFFEKVSNKIFYKDRYDPQKLVNDIGRIVASEIDLDKMTKAVLVELTDKMKIARAEIVIFGEKQLFYENDVFNIDGNKISESELRKLGRVIQIADDMADGDKKKLMQSYGIAVSIALRTKEKFLGYLLLAEKKSGDIYNNEDIATLQIIANELSVAIQNSLSYKEIQQFSETLAKKVRQRTAQLRHANDQLKELDRAKDEFISMASHQLRTPLTTIKGYVSMLDEGDFGKLNKQQKECVELALDSSNRMARLIDDLLNVSRMEAGKFFIDAQKIDLNTIVPQEIDQLRSLAQSKNVDLHYIPPKEPVPIMNLDENKTRQVIMNLVDNAIHYSAPPKGGGKVEVRLERDGEDIVYVVRDNGIGVPKDQQGKLFTKMFRAKNAQEVRPDGTGLGLYLVKRVVEDQGGKLIFESTPGKGSVFGFRMPIHNKIFVDKEAQNRLVAAHKND
jgi:signal transduction histidine kinase